MERAGLPFHATNGVMVKRFQKEALQARQQITLMVLVLVMGFATTISASTWQTIRRIDHEREQRAKLAVSATLQSEINDSQTFARTLDHWDDELLDTISIETRNSATEGNAPLFETQSAEGHFDLGWVINDANETVLTLMSPQTAIDAQRLSSRPKIQDFTAPLRHGLDQRSGLIAHDGALSVLTAIRLRSQSPLSDTLLDGKRGILLIEKRLSPDVLTRKGTLLQLEGLSFGTGKAGQHGIALRDADENTIGHVRWRASASSVDFAVSALPLTISLASIFIGLALILMRRAQTSFRQLNRQAKIDWLSQLPNRHAFHLAARQATQKGEHVALALIDLDSFKMINDYHGHKTGDELVRIVARLLESKMPRNSFIARLGGDEFAVLVSGPDSQNVLFKACEALHESMKSSIQVGDVPLLVSSSIGIVESEDGANASELLRRADLAMYAAKRSGKGCSVLHNPMLDRRSSDNLKLKDDLVAAIRDHSICLHYQPILSADTGKIAAVEALARWTDPNRGAVPANTFIPIAEEFGLIAPLGNQLLERACREWAEHSATRLTANISAAHVGRPDFAETVTRILEKTSFPPTRLEIEITETSLVKDGHRAKNALSALTDLGVRIALDDFGSGFASIGFLQKFHFDMLKIDRAIIANCVTSESARSMLQACVAMANVLEIEITAEGIETEEQAIMMRALGCQYLQGFLYTPAVPLPDAIAMIAKSRPNYRLLTA